jgi:hypothetical protein
MVNGFKLAAQRKKALAIVGAIDAVALSKGINPHDQSGRILLAMLDWPESAWLSAAKMANVNPPSAETKALVVDVFRGRAKAPVQPVAVQ